VKKKLEDLMKDESLLLSEPVRYDLDSPSVPLSPSHTQRERERDRVNREDLTLSLSLFLSLCM